jgi:prevent-host-death family protein
MKGAMRLRGDFTTVTSLKSGAAEFLRYVSETRHPVVITQSGKPKAVLIDLESYEELRKATMVRKLIAQGEADVRARRTISQNEVFKTVRARLIRED